MCIFMFCSLNFWMSSQIFLILHLYGSVWSQIKRKIKQIRCYLAFKWYLDHVCLISEWFASRILIRMFHTKAFLQHFIRQLRCVNSQMRNQVFAKRIYIGCSKFRKSAKDTYSVPVAIIFKREVGHSNYNLK